MLEVSLVLFSLSFFCSVWVFFFCSCFCPFRHFFVFVFYFWGVFFVFSHVFSVCLFDFLFSFANKMVFL